MFKFIRIVLLLFLLLAVVIGYLIDSRQTQWHEQLWVSIYPINADGSADTQKYIDDLKPSDFLSIGDFINQEAEYWNAPITTPLAFNLAPQISQIPPAAPKSSTLANILYSLQLRFWVWRHANSDFPEDIRIMVQYFKPEEGFALSHSIGIEKGKIGLVNAYSSRLQQQQNQFVIAHELLHTLGATDKYQPADNQPVFPDGYANPNQNPLLPQQLAEIMGGRIAISKTESLIPESFDQVVIGSKTAAEIGWLRADLHPVKASNLE